MEEEDSGGAGIDRRAERFRQIFGGGPPFVSMNRSSETTAGICGETEG